MELNNQHLTNYENITKNQLNEIINENGGAIYFSDNSALGTSSGGNKPIFYPEYWNESTYRDISWEEALEVFKSHSGNYLTFDC